MFDARAGVRSQVANNVADCLTLAMLVVNVLDEVQAVLGEAELVGLLRKIFMMFVFDIIIDGFRYRREPVDCDVGQRVEFLCGRKTGRSRIWL